MEEYIGNLGVLVRYNFIHAAKILHGGRRGLSQKYILHVSAVAGSEVLRGYTRSARDRGSSGDSRHHFV